MKRNETALGGSVEYFFVPKRSANEHSLVKRHKIESRVSRVDTNSSSRRRRRNRGLEDEFQTPWLFQTSTTSKED
jgi:hypothetical protein